MRGFFSTSQHDIKKFLDAPDEFLQDNSPSGNKNLTA